MFITQENITVHFVGIGGIGMSGIAEVLVSLGYRVTGSDITRSGNVEKLESLGAKIHIGHKYENIAEDVTVLVYSSAIDETNPEIVAARDKQVPLMRRAEMLAELMRLKHGIAVAGTHGKTTTTSFLATILAESGIDPTYIIGGIVSNLSGHAKVGKGKCLVAEADESDGSFLLLNPIMSVITNIDLDHMNYYGTEENLIHSFKKFANKVPFYGKCALNAHDERLMQIKKEMKKPWLTFGIHDLGVVADYEARDVIQTNAGARYQLYIEGEHKGEISISIPGDHNILNSLGAISMAHQMGVEVDSICHSISKFEGIARRFQILHTSDELEIIDDYAHHPTEIVSTLKAVKETRPTRKVLVVFEPHRYSRTRDCWKDFFHCFNHADELYLCPIYAASEAVIEGISAERLVSDINSFHPNQARALSSLEEIEKVIAKNKGEKLTLVTLGAGAIGRNIREFVSTKL
ncbi:MAG: UDP-N-acetylmuramate--L-alanine ligase [Bacteriovoracaceae bacterium]|nr:UDP-N-acetylmuramate--L-alanine ligase [Bacteriovoracaceae bacterium]